jgi:MoaA/NifB/PqqE/SkfB family radical SAM enzyme
MKIEHMLLRLATRGLRYRFLKTLGLPAKPEALSLEITRRCIARCIMCNIWQSPSTASELEARDWLKLLESPLLSELKELDITGGEPFLRKDFTELMLGIGKLKASHLKRLCSVAITTNGFLTDKILGDVSAVIASLETAGVPLVFACGFDAVGDIHDRIRRFKGGWERLHATMEGLVALREKFPSLVLGIKTTVSRHNIDQLDRICRYAENRGLFTIISPFILTANRYANLQRKNALAFSIEDMKKLRRFYQLSRFQWSHYRNEMLHFLDTGRMDKPCSAGFNYFFIRSTGEIYACPIIDAPLGNVKETPFETLVRNASAACFRRHILKFSECRACTEPGMERYALAFEGFHYLRQYFKLGRKAFLSLHEHMGLDKYFQ